jgi:hypothetical protein
MDVGGSAAAGRSRIGLKKPKQKPTLSDPEARGLIFASGLVEHGALLWRFKMPPHECPNCGASITFAAEEQRLGLMGVFGIALVCLWLIGLIFLSATILANKSLLQTGDDACAAAQSAVLERLKSPSSVDLSECSPSHRSYGQGLPEIVSGVASFVNSAGTRLNASYSVTMALNKGRWSVTYVKIGPRHLGF